MAATPTLTLRVERDVLDQIRERHQLAEATNSDVVRHALAVAAGVTAEAIRPSGVPGPPKGWRKYRPQGRAA